MRGPEPRPDGCSARRRPLARPGVGQVLDALRSNGLEENTLVAFSSDNGVAHYVGMPGLNAPYRGWKLIVDGRQKKRWLFDLASDPTERVDRAEEEPEIASALAARLDAHDREIGPRSYPVLVEAVIPIDRTILGPWAPGDEYSYWPN